jgi:L-alanine-DL-glutamate epimerase-like enolase superfamily enzyme
MHIARIEPLILHVSARTNWFFVRVTSDNGLQGIGEASLNAWETMQQAFLRQIDANLVGRPVAEVGRLTAVYPHAPYGLIGASVLSALEQALTDILRAGGGVARP